MIIPSLIHSALGAGVVGQLTGDTSNSTINSMVQGICGFIAPLTGKSQVLSLVFVIALGVMIFLWFMNENKEGVIVWLLRAGLAIAILINIFTLPQLIGLQPLTCTGAGDDITTSIAAPSGVSHFTMNQPANPVAQHAG